MTTSYSHGQPAVKAGDVSPAVDIDTAMAAAHLVDNGERLALVDMPMCRGSVHSNTQETRRQLARQLVPRSFPATAKHSISSISSLSLQGKG